MDAPRNTHNDRRAHDDTWEKENVRMSEIALRRVREVLGTCEKKFGIEEKAEKFMRTDVLSGNEQVGTVEHIRQAHNITYGLTSLFIDRETQYSIALQHMEMVRYLMQGKFDAVF